MPSTNARTTVRLTDDQIIQLEELIQEKGLKSQSAAIKYILDRYFEKPISERGQDFVSQETKNVIKNELDLNSKKFEQTNRLLLIECQTMLRLMVNMNNGHKLEANELETLIRNAIQDVDGENGISAATINRAMQNENTNSLSIRQQKISEPLNQNVEQRPSINENKYQAPYRNYQNTLQFEQNKIVDNQQSKSSHDIPYEPDVRRDGHGYDI